jgi:hypothetical protein
MVMKPRYPPAGASFLPAWAGRHSVHRGNRNIPHLFAIWESGKLPNTVGLVICGETPVGDRGFFNVSFPIGIERSGKSERLDTRFRSDHHLRKELP